MNNEQQLRSTLENQQKIIKFLKTKYREDTGADIKVP